MKPLVIIPTFYSDKTKTDASREIARIYDHATPITQMGDLPRCLESLQKVQGLGLIAILVVSDPSVERQAIEKVQSIIAKFPCLNCVIIGKEEESLVQKRLTQLGATNLSKEIGLGSYGAVRNLGLVLANTLGFNSVVFLDDDEIVEDADFMQRAMYGLGKLTRKGIPILAKTGFYFNDEGSYLAKPHSRWFNSSWNQGEAFNQWIEKAMHGPRLSRSNHVCGGCLVIHKEAFQRLSFDPWIPRGEDLDYMLDLRMYGSDVWFDNQLSLTHLPPASASDGRRFKQDVYRWLYEYRKMEYSRTQIDLLQVKPESLEPYPGPFLEADVYKRLVKTARAHSLIGEDAAAYRDALRAAKGEASEYAERYCTKYFGLQFVWPEVMAAIENDQVLSTALVRSMVLRAQGEVPDGVLPEIPRGDIDPGKTGEVRLNIEE